MVKQALSLSQIYLLFYNCVMMGKQFQTQTFSLILRKIKEIEMHENIYHKEFHKEDS